MRLLHVSALCETGRGDFYLHIEALAEYVKKYCPKTKLLVHETWADEEGSERLNTICASYKEMYLALINCFVKAANAVKAHGIIPSGEDISCNTFSSFGVPVNGEERELAIREVELAFGD